MKVKLFKCLLSGILWLSIELVCIGESQEKQSKSKTESHCTTIITIGKSYLIPVTYYNSVLKEPKNNS